MVDSVIHAACTQFCGSRIWAEFGSCATGQLAGDHLGLSALCRGYLGSDSRAVPPPYLHPLPTDNSFKPALSATAGFLTLGRRSGKGLARCCPALDAQLGALCNGGAPACLAGIATSLEPCSCSRRSTSCSIFLGSAARLCHTLSEDSPWGTTGLGLALGA